MLSGWGLQVEAGSSEPGVEVEALLRTELQQNEKLDIGYLENGLRYVILPNRAPPNRFEAHLEVHAGEWAGAGSGACSREGRECGLAKALAGGLEEAAGVQSRSNRQAKWAGAGSRWSGAATWLRRQAFTGASSRPTAA